jgi:predicted MFS family arabinose efflux permease
VVTTLPVAAIAMSALLALALAMGIGRFAFTPIFPLMQSQFGLALADGAWLAAANYGGYLAGSLAAIWLRTSTAAAVPAGLYVIGVATVGMAFTDRLGIWMLLRFAAGVASAFVLVYVSAWALERLKTAGHPSSSGVVFSGVGVGIFLCGLACVALAQSGHGATEAWIALGTSSLALGAVVHAVVCRDSRGQIAKMRPPFSLRSRSRDFWRLVGCYGAFGFAYIIPATFLPTMAKAALADSSLFAYIWPVFGLAAAVSTPLAAIALTRSSPRALWIGAGLVMAVGLLTPVVLDGLAPILTSALCVGGTFMVITMAGMQEARRLGAGDAPSYMAAMTTAFALGQIAGPLLVGTVSVGVAFEFAMTLASVLLVASALILWKGEFH